MPSSSGFTSYFWQLWIVIMLERLMGAVQQTFRLGNANKKKKHKKSKAQLEAESRRQQVNAPVLVSNGVLIETVTDTSSNSHLDTMDLEQQAPLVTPPASKASPSEPQQQQQQQQHHHPYLQQNRMTTVLEPSEDHAGNVIVLR